MKTLTDVDLVQKCNYSEACDNFVVPIDLSRRQFFGSNQKMKQWVSVFKCNRQSSLLTLLCSSSSVLNSFNLFNRYSRLMLMTKKLLAPSTLSSERLQVYRTRKSPLRQLTVGEHISPSRSVSMTNVHLSDIMWRKR